MGASRVAGGQSDTTRKAGDKAKAVCHIWNMYMYMYVCICLHCFQGNLQKWLKGYWRNLHRLVRKFC